MRKRSGWALWLLASQLTVAAPLDELGRMPSAAELIEVDTDVMPDGTGLPAGSGTVADGQRVYQQYCVSCHGEQGRGGTHNVLVDPSGEHKTIANYWPYPTTIFDYIRRAMPYDRAGLLTDEEVYSVTAYLLFLSGLITDDVALSADTLVAIEMPATHRFVRDDRRGGAEIR